jgi:hypothetical protein
VGVDVIVADDSVHPVKPDAVFPNNWVTFHEDGTVVTYPMYAPVRRLERREDLVKELSKRFSIQRKIHLEEFETLDIFLEGTGSMILDRPNKLAFACLSPRTNEELFSRFCKLMNYDPVVFHAADGRGQEIYHTNVLMALGASFVVICMESVRDPFESDMLRRRFAATGKEVIEISLAQMMSFAGNMLQVRNQAGDTFLVMSEQAYDSLLSAQKEKLQRHTRLLYAGIPTIEKFGGGSVRCMMAEIFLPEKTNG